MFSLHCENPDCERVPGICSKKSESESSLMRLWKWKFLYEALKVKVPWWGSESESSLMMLTMWVFSAQGLLQNCSFCEKILQKEVLGGAIISIKSSVYVLIITMKGGGVKHGGNQLWSLYLFSQLHVTKSKNKWPITVWNCSGNINAWNSNQITNFKEGSSLWKCNHKTCIIMYRVFFFTGYPLKS